MNHTLSSIVYDNIGEGWRIECSCGWESEPHPNLESAGADMDEHMKTKGKRERRENRP